MAENDLFWELYWDIHLRDMEGLGKREAILAASKRIRRMSGSPGQAVRILELGCGTGDVIGRLVDAHTGLPGIHDSLGVDYLPTSIAASRARYPGLRFVEADFTDLQWVETLGQFELVLLVNALHEVFSAVYNEENGEIDIALARQQVKRAIAGAASRVAQGGWLLLFDGLEPPADPNGMIQLRFVDRQAERLFEQFAREYRPFRITYQPAGGLGRITLSRRSFTRYITKSIFLGKSLWQSERLESYQYYSEADFRSTFTRIGLQIVELHTFTVNEEKWRRFVEIETPGVQFPEEHILILARR